ncbi:carbonyl reductase [NADPH] 1-like [Pieris rapae]|uniref:carbonyl reductase [NADPH] 1-like n=1 Tax=Pieris rapae TaxID=64459 RepID=UPI001E28050A|nr:carbonyl reductase [NADPH] 1-like [Pieris rapae]
MTSKIAVVTGSNQGIGFGIVRELCRRNVGVVYLTSRDIQRGKEAVAKLEKDGFYPKYHQLDVSDEESVKTFAEYMKNKYGGLDILINNAGVLDSDYYKVSFEEAKRVIDVNVHGIILMQKYFFPLLRDNARVINMSSDWGHITNIKNPYWVQRLTNKDIKLGDVYEFLNWFLDSVKNNALKEEDFFENTVLAYRVSKVAVSALTGVQQKEVGKGISINCLNPGFVKTNMTVGGGDMTVIEAGVTPAYLALDIDQSVKGKYFWFDKTEVDWADSTLNVLDTFDAFEKAIGEVNK